MRPDIIKLLKAIYPNAEHYFVNAPVDGIPLSPKDIRGYWTCGFIDSLAVPTDCYCEKAKSINHLGHLLKGVSLDFGKLHKRNHKR
jgi:hypothetical protein